MRMNVIALVSISALIPCSEALATGALAKRDGVPRFDIERTCREARSFTGADKEVSYKGCLKDESDAHDQLAQKWTRFKQVDRQDCVAQGAAPMPSYVELLTCLEMSAEAGELDAPKGAHAAQSGPARASSPETTAPSEPPPPGNGTPATKN